MTIARSQIVDPEITRWYHCISRCVRQAFLLKTDEIDRKAWMERRMAELAEVFAISICGFSILDNHFHLLIRLDPDVAKKWTDEEVATRWGRLFPPRGKDRKPLEIQEKWLKEKLADKAWVAKSRARLQNLGWFMKCLKEPLARLANRQDGTKGFFFEGRYKSIALLDDESLLAVCAYIDLNPVAAGISPAPEVSNHTSVEQRVTHVRNQRRLSDLTPAKISSMEASKHAEGLEDGHWLCPIEDRRRIDSSREGMLEGYPLASYLLLLDYTGRLYRHGKASIKAGVAEIFTRLGTDSDTWWGRLRSLARERPRGNFLAATPSRIREAMAKLRDAGREQNVVLTHATV